MNQVTTVVFCILIIFVATTLGSATVFFFRKNFSSALSSVVMGLASGIMISVSVFGLLVPAMKEKKWLPVTIGFLAGCMMLGLLDKIVPHIHRNKEEFGEGIKTKKLDKNIKFFLAVTMHNIPEGIAVGLAAALAFTAAPKDASSAVAMASAMAVAIAVQNVPEGAAVSVPLFESGMKKGTAFNFGFLSGVVEPIFAIIAFFAAKSLDGFMPWLLSFAAGAMIYVTVEEMIPDIKGDEESHYGIWAFIIGFMSMMLMELLL